MKGEKRTKLQEDRLHYLEFLYKKNRFQAGNKERIDTGTKRGREGKEEYAG